MSVDLKARLRRYKDAHKLSASTTEEPRATLITQSTTEEEKNSWPDWTEAGFKTLKREVLLELEAPVPEAFPAALPIVVPDLSEYIPLRMGKLPSSGELLFFDLETTGLSGGAGTIAFLAAFGRFAKDCVSNDVALAITQYLLLDYPGEADFIERVAGEFTALPPPLVITYNGKSFDSQILKNRCLMNGMVPPEYFHADLLHPARRLWKRTLPDCSQATIEVSVLGLDRAGDVPGAMAPEIWFSFLRNGDNTELLSICDHNVRDITGLASLFLALNAIAAAPLESQNRFRFDMEALALIWRSAIRRNPQLFGDEEKKTGEELFRDAAQNGSPFAALILAKNAEWRLKDYKLALEYTDSALASQEISEELRENFERRRRRLERKINHHNKLTGSTSTSR
ncbi:MAG: ribonuclease H-like domain-containing protein [Treponema sp.]|jgi:uncharacterized protein YprB with RNaseH-like and TPR domain|nr:ribonuclease H-like domain-containing protein [Treponema sp.]